MTRNNNHFIFTLLRYIPLTIHLLVNHYWQRLFSTTPKDERAQSAELIGFTLRLLGVKVTDHRLYEIAEISPNHLGTDATESIPFLLDQWNIHTTVGILDDSNNAAGNNLDSLTLPCLIRLDNGEAATILSISKENHYILLYHPKDGIKVMAKEALDSIWSGFFFTIDINKSLQQPLYSEHIMKEFWRKWRYSLTASFFVLLISISIVNQLINNSGIALILWLSVGLCLLSGFSLSFILAQHSMGNSGGLLASLCSHDSSRSCSDIIDNPKAKFFGIPHSDIGIVYFSSSFVLLSTSSSIPWLVASLSILALGYSLYSFIFQHYIIGRWCRLCLAVQAVVILQAFIIFIASKQLNFLPTVGEYPLSIALIIFTLPGILWATIRHSLVTEKNSHELEQQFKDVILNEDKIQIIEHKKKSRLSYSFIDDGTSNNEGDESLEGDIILGKNDSQDLRVTIGLSPNCNHCGIFLEEIIQFISSKHWPITLRIRLIISEGYEQDAINDRTLAENITALAVSDGSGIAIEALRNWYQTFEAKDIKAWEASIRNITSDEINDVSILLADTSYWVSQNNIDAMPALFVENEYIPYVSAEYSTILLRKICLI